MTATPWDIEGKWSISHYSYCDEVRVSMPYLPRKVTVRDITFREGDDCIGLRISIPDKIKLLEHAVKMGIEEVDNGGPSMHPHQYAFARAVKESGLPVRSTGRFFALTKDFKHDVDIDLEAGSTNFRVVLMQLSEKITLEQLDKMPDIIDYIHKCGVKVCSGLSDGTRAPLALLDRVNEGILACGVDKIMLMDTFGVGNTAVMKYLATRIKKMIPEDMPFLVHMHNTYGLASANTLACVEGGANEVDLAINGYGDEAGNASMEEVVVSLEALYGVDTGLKLNMFAKYSKMAEEFGKVRCQPHKAIIGESAFLRPLIVWGGHDMARESWMLHEPLDPELVGMESHVVFGPEASLDDEPVELKLKELGLSSTGADILKMRNAVEDALKKERVYTGPTPYITEAEFDELAKKLIGKNA